MKVFIRVPYLCIAHSYYRTYVLILQGLGIGELSQVWERKRQVRSQRGLPEFEIIAKGCFAGHADAEAQN
jgi:hypothetical protein